MDDPEHILTGGNVAASVVRIGNTVRKPAGPATPFIHAFLRHLRSAGFSGCPRPIGFDQQGRQILEFVPGETAASKSPLPLEDLTAVGRTIRLFHDISAACPIPPEARDNILTAPDREDLLCHNDLAPWNFVLGSERCAFIDWDSLAPASRLWDLAWAAITFPVIARSSDPASIHPRIASLTQGYGLTIAETASLPSVMRRRALSMRDLLVEGHRTNTQPWARLYAADHATHWSEVATFIGTNLL